MAPPANHSPPPACSSCGIFPRGTTQREKRATTKNPREWRALAPQVDVAHRAESPSRKCWRPSKGSPRIASLPAQLRDATDRTLAVRLYQAEGEQHNDEIRCSSPAWPKCMHRRKVINTQKATLQAEMHMKISHITEEQHACRTDISYADDASSLSQCGRPTTFGQDAS